MGYGTGWASGGPVNYVAGNSMSSLGIGEEAASQSPTAMRYDRVGKPPPIVEWSLFRLGLNAIIYCAVLLPADFKQGTSVVHFFGDPS